MTGLTKLMIGSVVGKSVVGKLIGSGLLGSVLMGSEVSASEVPDNCEVDRPVHMTFVLDETSSMQTKWGKMKEQMIKAIENIEETIPNSRYTFFRVLKYNEGCNPSGYVLGKGDAIKAVEKFPSYQMSGDYYPSTLEEALASGQYTEVTPESRNSQQAEATIWCSLHGMNLLLEENPEYMTDAYKQGLTIITDDIPLLQSIQPRDTLLPFPTTFEQGTIPSIADFYTYQYPDMPVYYDMLNKLKLTPFYVIGVGDRGGLLNYWWKNQLIEHNMDPEIYASFYNPNGDGISTTITDALITMTCRDPTAEPTQTPTPTDPTNPGETPTNPGETPTNPGETPTNPGETPTNPGETPTDPPTQAPNTETPIIGKCCDVCAEIYAQY